MYCSDRKMELDRGELIPALVVGKSSFFSSKTFNEWMREGLFEARKSAKNLEIFAHFL
jgi:hypothetical protein